MTEQIVSPEALRQQAKIFRDAANQCDSLADLLDSCQTTTIARPIIVRPGTSTDQVIKYLEDHGPMRRKELYLIGLPKGTIDMILNKKTMFKRDGDGRYSVIGQTKEA